MIGAGRYERTDTRSNERDGTRSRVLSTATGDLQVGIPKLRKGRSSRRCSSPAGGSTRRCTR